jgi:NADH dehydrogenase FAD-containing subunit
MRRSPPNTTPCDFSGGNLSEARQRILESLDDFRVVVVRGRPAGVEVSGNAAAMREGRKLHISVVAGKRMLQGFPASAQRPALRSLGARGVQVFEGTNAERIEEREIHLQNGRFLPYDLCFLATGVRPPDLFGHSEMPTGNDGGLAVIRHLQCSRYPRVFGGGNCIHFLPRPLHKVGVHAVRQGPVLRHNLLAVLEGRPLRTFKPKSTYMLILNLGDGRGLLLWRSIALHGKLFFSLKDRIDRRFVNRFAVK